MGDVLFEGGGKSTARPLPTDTRRWPGEIGEQGVSGSGQRGGVAFGAKTRITASATTRISAKPIAKRIRGRWRESLGWKPPGRPLGGGAGATGGAAGGAGGAVMPPVPGIGSG